MKSAIVFLALLGFALAHLAEDTGRYVPDDSGKYVPDGQGLYKPSRVQRSPKDLSVDDGRYVKDDEGKYVPDGTGLYHEKAPKRVQRQSCAANGTPCNWKGEPTFTNCCTNYCFQTTEETMGRCANPPSGPQ